MENPASLSLLKAIFYISNNPTQKLMPCSDKKYLNVISNGWQDLFTHAFN